MSFQEMNVLVLVITGGVAWWLSGQDVRLCAGTHFQELTRRLVRVMLTLVLMEVVVFELYQYRVNNDWLQGGIALFVLLLLVFLWIGALSHLGARGFNQILDPSDNRAFDPNQQVRQLDRVGALIRAGKKPAAIRLCRKLIASGEGDRSVLEMTLAHLQAPEVGDGKIRLGGERAGTASPAAGAAGSESLEDLLKNKYYGSAIELLERKVKEQPGDVELRLKLAEVHAVHCHNYKRAEKIVEDLPLLPGVTPEQLAQAEERLHQWKK